MQLMDSHVAAGQELPARDRQAYYAALIEYVAYGIEPKLSGAAKAVFVAIRPTLDNSRARAEAGRAGGSKTQSKTEANHEANAKQSRSKRASAQGKQTASEDVSKQPSKTEANTEANAKQNDKQNENKRASYQDSLSYSYSPSPSGEGVQGEGADPPTLDEARAYFAANLLRGDPELFWATYEATGWLDGNGRPIVSWTAQALRWSRRQVAMDAASGGPAAPAPEPVNAASAAPTDEELEAEARAFFERHGFWPEGYEGADAA